MISRDSSPNTNRRFFQLILGAIFLVLTLAIAVQFLAGEGSGETLYVDDDAAPGGDGSLALPYQNIQDAVDNATEDDTIRVFNGTYLENVVIDTTVDLIGNNSVDTIIDRVGDGISVHIRADWCNVSGFTVTGSGGVSNAAIKIESNYNTIKENNCSGNSNFGIYLNTADSNSIYNNTCSNNSHGIYLENSNSITIFNNTCNFNDGDGIRLKDSYHFTLSSNTMVGNGISIISNLQDNLINTYNMVHSNNTVNGNPVYFYKNGTDFTVPLGAGQVILVNCSKTIIENQNCSNGSIGIDVMFSSNITITNNTCNSNNIYGIRLHYSDFNTVTNNTCNMNYSPNIILRSSDSNTLSFNTCGQGFREGIELRYSDHNTLSNNICNLNDKGINLEESINNTLSNNTCKFNQNGVYIEISSDNEFLNNSISDNTVGMSFIFNSENNEAHFNSIFNNTDNGIDADDNNKIVNATNNWWGNDTGPYHPTENPEGTGDNVTDDVLFDPWTGKQTQDTSTIYVSTEGDDDTGDGSEENPYLTIQKGIDSATNDTHTIRVFEGTYNENVIVNKSLAIVGNASSNTTIDGQFNIGLDVVAISEDGATIQGFTITNSGQAGISVMANDVTIIDCSISNNNDEGIIATDVTGLEIGNCIVQSNTGDGISIDPSSDILINGTMIMGNENGLSLDATTDVLVANSDLSFNNNFDLIFTSSSTANLTDTNYGDASMDLTSSFEIWWEFALEVQDENGTALEGARVVLTDVNTDPVFDGLTDANGNIPLYFVQEGTVTQIGLTSLNDHTINITKDGLDPTEEFLTIDVNQDLLYQLTPPVPGPEALVNHDTVFFVIESVDTIDLDATPSTGNDLEYLWTFEDNSTDINPMVTDHGPYDKAGVYIITLLVTDDQDRNDSLEVRVVVTNVAPEGAQIDDGNNKTGEEDEIISFGGTATDTDPLTYIWDFGDTTGGVGQNVDHSYTEKGNYTVVLTVADDDGAVNITEINVEITNKKPTSIPVKLNVGDIDSTVVVYFSAVDSTDTPSDMATLTYGWEFGDNTFGGGMFPTHTFGKQGTYDVNLTVTDDDGVSHTNTVSVTVSNRDPIADAGDNITAAREEDIEFIGTDSEDSDPTGTIVNWTWDLDNGEFRYNDTFIYNYTVPGIYTVNLEVTDDGGNTNGINIFVTIENDLPTNRTLETNETALEGELVNFTGSAEDTDNLTYSWDFGDGSEVVIGEEVNHTFLAPGTFTINLTISDGFDDVFEEQEITITNMIPFANFTATKTTADQGEEITFNGIDSFDLSGAELTYAWDFGDGDTGTGVSIKHTFMAPGTKNVELTVNDGFDDSDPFTVEITIENIEPTASFSASATDVKTTDVVSFDGSDSSDAGDDDLTYTWDFGDNSTEGTGQTATHTYATEGTYNVTLTVSDGTDTHDTSRTITVTKGGGTTTTETSDGGGLGLIGIIALIIVVLLLIILIPLVLFVTDKKPKELPGVLKMVKEGKTIKDVSGGAGTEVEAVMAVEAVEAVEVEAVVEGVVSGEALEAALVAEVEISGTQAGGRRSRKDVKLIDEEVNEFEAKKASFGFMLRKMERERDLLKGDLERDQSDSRKKETERQLANVEGRITKQVDKIKKIDVEVEKEKERKATQAKLEAAGLSADGVGMEGGVFDEEAIAASVPKPDAMAALEASKVAVDRLNPAKHNELERKQAELDAYADYADDPDYADYVADLQMKVDVMGTFVKRREKSGKGSGFISTVDMAKMNERLMKIKAKGKKGASKKDAADKQEFERKIGAFEDMTGQSIDDLLDELYAESIEEIDTQIAEEEAVWEEAKLEAIETARSAFEARQAAAEAIKSGAEAEAGVGEAEAVEAEAVEAETVEAEAVEAEAVEAEAVEAETVEAEAVEAEAVEAEAVEAEEVEAEAVEAEAVEAEAVEAEAVEAEAVEVEGVEVEGVEVEGVEVEGVEVEGVEIAGAEKKTRSRQTRKSKDDSSISLPKGATQVTCKYCNTQLAVGTKKRPYSFNCPKCTKKITLEDTSGIGKTSDAIEKKSAPGTPVTCPRCRTSMNVGTTQRPFTFNCPKCSQRITLQSSAPGGGGGVGGPPSRGYGGPGAQAPSGGYPPAQAYGQAGYQQPPPMGPPGGTMSCPGCRAQLDVSQLPRPSTFNCPHCRTRIDLR